MRDKTMGKTVKSTTQEVEYDQEQGSLYSVPDPGPCPFHQAGQVRYTDGLHMPESMCGVIWQILQPWISRLAKGKLVQPSAAWLRDAPKVVFS